MCQNPAPYKFLIAWGKTNVNINSTALKNLNYPNTNQNKTSIKIKHQNHSFVHTGKLNIRCVLLCSCLMQKVHLLIQINNISGSI